MDLSADGSDPETHAPVIEPLPSLELSAQDQFEPLMAAMRTDELTPTELEVVQLLKSQRAVVKTIKNCDWTSFLQRFWKAQKIHHHFPDIHDDCPSTEEDKPFNSFVTSTSLL